MNAEALPQETDAGGAARRVAVVWLPFALAYFCSSALRNVNAVLVPELTAEFTLSAADLGLLTSVFFAAFSLIQLPGGMLLDRYGSRRVHAALLWVAWRWLHAWRIPVSWPWVLGYAAAIVGVTELLHLGSTRRLPAPEAGHRCIERDAIDPRREGRVASEGPDLAVHLHQHVLGHLLGIGRVAHMTQGQLVNTWSKSLGQLLHGGLVSRLEPAYQLTVNAPVHGVLVYVQKNTDRFGLIPVPVTCSFG